MTEQGLRVRFALDALHRTLQRMCHAPIGQTDDTAIEQLEALARQLNPTGGVRKTNLAPMLPAPIGNSGAPIPDGFYSPTDIAKAMQVPEKTDAIRMALKRLFDQNGLPDTGWMENNNPAKGQARILYRLSAVRSLLARFELPQSM